MLLNFLDSRQESLVTRRCSLRIKHDHDENHVHMYAPTDV